MAVHIDWVEDCVGEEIIESVTTPICSLNVYRRQDVITRIDWDFSQETNKSALGKRPFFEFWPNSKQAVKLLKQGTVYQNKVWAELLKIPCGETLTYSALAKKIGSAARAVGNACRSNPYTLLIPCHRVVAVNGLGGYSGHRHGEYMMIKQKLLAFEAAQKTCKITH